jgi:hypothetical protein
MDLHLLGLPLGLPLPPAVAVLPHKLFLLGIDRDHGLTLPLKRLGSPIDVLELGIPVRVALALDRLVIGLEAVAQIVEQSVDRPLADDVPSGLEPLGQLVRTLARPPQRRDRVATSHGIDQGFQFTKQVWIMIGHRLATTPRRTQPSAGERFVIFGGQKIQLLQARSDGGPCEPGSLGDSDDPAPAERSCLHGGPEAASPLVEQRFEGDVLCFDDLGEWVRHESNCNNIQVETGNLFWRAALAKWRG